ncbi:hypothetical protein C8J57DRAFT_1244199 [Mycena rebaudengoi]|nr:hypothetical protein C8J57DRAFT_1244199 [Mycena rebaudengoi]
MKFVPHLTLALAMLPLLLLASPSPPEVHLRTGTWTDIAPTLHGPCQEHSVVALSSDIKLDSSIHAANQHVTQHRALPHTVNHGNAAMVNSKLYLLGGLDGMTGWVAFPQSYMYSPVVDEWAALLDMPVGTACGAATVGMHGHTVYLVGRVLHTNLITGTQLSSATVSAFNTLTCRWRVLPSLPEVHDHVGRAVIGDMFFNVGGRVVNVRDTVFALDLNTVGLGWVEKVHMPAAQIYTFGGEGDANLVPNSVYDNVEVYCMGEDRWEVLPLMLHPRHGTNATSIVGQIYIPGRGNVMRAGLQSLTDFFSP